MAVFPLSNIVFAQDICFDAVFIELDTAPIASDNTGATATQNGCDDISPNAPEVWFSFVGTGVLVDIEVFAGTLEDSQLGIYDTCGGSCLAEDDDSGIDNAAKVSGFFAELGMTYFIEIQGFNGAEGDFTISVATSIPSSNDCNDSDTICCTDINRNNVTDIADLVLLLNKFGSVCTSCPEDINGDGITDTSDLLQFLTLFGSFCLQPEKNGPEIVFSTPPFELQPQIDLPLDLVDPLMLLNTSDPILMDSLLTASLNAPLGPHPFDVFLGLIPGLIPEGQLQIEFDVSHPLYFELLDFPNLPAAPDGLYTGVGMTFISANPEFDNIFSFNTIVSSMIDTHKTVADSGGCCSTLAIAHSLVRKMGGIVTEDDATIDTDGDGDPDEWDPDFLKKVREATGDDDDCRGLSDGEAEDGHEADWNESWGVNQIDDNEPLHDDDGGDCDDLKERCENLIKRLETNDDITMRVFGKDGKKGDEWGHLAPVESASYSNGPPCKCEITITRTSRQEPNGRVDYKDIPYNPGTATYTITSDGTDTSVSNTEFPSSTINLLEFDSFDEHAKNSGVQATDQGEPGSALD